MPQIGGKAQGEVMNVEAAYSDVCDLCGRSGRRMVLDHCHETGRFRGWICHKCNIALGALGDDEAGLRRAIDYLNRRV